MNVKVKFFAVFHEMFSRREENMELPEGSTVMDILKCIESEKPEFADYYDIMQIAVNWEYATRNALLKNDDEVALIPPVTGG
ncbi:molybdopterin converting factor subunit 1 [Candidatus Poribacteria bacterium]|nr:molybdopterin converting factor subunit 1 [Candidatus Poribacteria bacterium]